MAIAGVSVPIDGVLNASATEHEPTVATPLGTKSSHGIEAGGFGPSGRVGGIEEDFPHIACRVVEAPFIGKKSPDWVRNHAVSLGELRRILRWFAQSDIDRRCGARPHLTIHITWLS